VNKPTVINVYFRAGTSHEGNDYMKCARILSFQYIFRLVLWMISWIHPSPSTTMVYRR